MDEYDRFFKRERARRRAQLGGRKSSSLWGFEHWARDRREDHHIRRVKFGEETVDVPFSMHLELTRRQNEEHPPDKGNAENRWVRLGRLLLGAADIVECLADLLWETGEALVEGKSALAESDYRLRGLRYLLPATQRLLDLVATKLEDSTEE